MSRRGKLLLLCVLLLIVAAGGAAYQFFIGLPAIFEGRRVRRVTVWAESSHFQRELLYYAYNGPHGEVVKHGPFQRFENGQLVQQATYRDGKVDGPIVYWNMLGEKTQEVYYHTGTPYGWANFAHDKLLKMRQEVTQEGRTVAVKTFDNDRYMLEFKCGELINAAIDPVSGQTSAIANASQRACAQP